MSGLSPLKDMKLTTLNSMRTEGTDLSPLNEFNLEFRSEHAEGLRSIMTLKKINGKAAGDLLK